LDKHLSETVKLYLRLKILERYGRTSQLIDKIPWYS